MKTAVYDNPHNSRREAWKDGKIVACMSKSLMYTRGFDGWPGMPFMLNCGLEFEPGRVLGDIEAIPQEWRPPVGIDHSRQPGNTSTSIFSTLPRRSP